MRSRLLKRMWVLVLWNPATSFVKPGKRVFDFRHRLLHIKKNVAFPKSLCSHPTCYRTHACCVGHVREGICLRDDERRTKTSQPKNPTTDKQVATPNTSANTRERGARMDDDRDYITTLHDYIKLGRACLHGETNVTWNDSSDSHQSCKIII